MTASESRYRAREGLYGESTQPSVVGRLVSKVKKAPGSAPGTLLHTGARKTDHVRIRLIDYDAEHIEEQELNTIDECFAVADDPAVTWVNIDGLHDVAVAEAVAQRFDVHRLAMEDVLSTTQRPKVEEYQDHFLVIVKMLSFDDETESVMPVRNRLRQVKGRIRSRGTDYLAYALIDAIVDSYFRILERVGDRIEDLEETVLEDPALHVMHRIHHLKREMLILRRAVWPLRETLGQMYRGEIPHVTEETQLFLRDVHDHAVQVIDTVETLREVLSGAMDLYMSGVSNRMNEVMKMLTIIATIFIPLSFFAGLYGMNFDYMPELGVRWAYPALLAAMATMAGGMLWYFRKRRWL